MKKISSFLFLISFYSCTSKLLDNNVLSTRSPSTVKLEKPFNVCYITINSNDEKRIFNQKLGAENFTHVELADGQQWVSKACESQRKCDVVVVSGHYAGHFFGETGYKLAPRIY